MSKLVLQPSTLITPEIGTLEYDGGELYFTPLGTQRGLVPSMQYYRLNSTLAMASSTSAQSILGVGVTLSSNIVYAFQAYYAMIKTTTTTSHTYGIGFGGTSTVSSIGYSVIRYFDTSGFSTVASPAYTGFIATTSNTTLIGPSASATNYQTIQINGIVTVSGTGTFIPQITISATGPIYTIQPNSYFSIYPIGEAGSNTSVGTWA